METCLHDALHIIDAHLHVSHLPRMVLGFSVDLTLLCGPFYNKYVLPELSLRFD